VYFILIPFKGEATIAVAAETEPEQVGKRPCDSVRVDHQIRVEGLYTFFYQEREQGFLFAGESHPMPELTYVDQGELHSVADGQDILLKQGDIAIFGPNQWHMHYADIGVAPRYVTITFDLEGVDITPLLNRKFVAPQQAVTLIQQMLREQERMDEFSSDMIISQLSLLMLTLLREASAPTGAKLRTFNAIHSENEIIRQAQQYISTHVRQKLSVPLVAKQVDVSPSYLTALFHKNLQISPGEYIRRTKLQESKQMIREDNLNFTEIAAALQYSTVHHFSRQFKEKFGITPTEYAKSVR
jgi:AraC-like DNA-binding protein